MSLSKKVFQRSEIIGYIYEGFLLVYYDQKFYLIDQHAAHQKLVYLCCLNKQRIPFIKKMINIPPMVSKATNFMVFIPNIYSTTLSAMENELKAMGWNYQFVQKKSNYTRYKINSAPSLCDAVLGEEDFIHLIDDLYMEKELSLSQKTKSRLAQYACHQSLRVGDRLKNTQMRFILDSLCSASSPFNCPHGRPVIISLKTNAFQHLAVQRKYVL